jgi:hypothetical protein
MTVASVPGALEVGTISSLDEFELLKGELDEVVRAMPRPSPFLLHGWLEHLVAERGPFSMEAAEGGRVEDR